ncbi:MAG: hypothetical protein RLZZ196_194 [Bacteroidota bacterium]
MMNTNLVCTYPKSYIHVTQALLNDQKKYTMTSVLNDLIKDFEVELYANKSEDVYYEAAIKEVLQIVEKRKAQISSQTTAISTASI